MLTAYAAAYLASLVVFLGADAVWLGTMVSRLYRPQLGALLSERPRWAPAALFYLAYPAGVVALAIDPALTAGQWGPALWRGALLGAACYGTYNLTNQATLRQWSVAVAATDTAWGTILTAIAATAGYWGALVAR